MTIAEWVLVLAIYASNGAPAITSVPMESEQACRTAAEVAVASKANSGLKGVAPICVRTK
jgi:hypothetical protein